MTDSFRTHGRSLTSPPEDAAPIAPDDAAALPQATRAIFAGGEGDLRVRMLGGGVVRFANLPAGTLLPLRIAQVFATGTSATDLVGLW